MPHTLTFDTTADGYNHDVTVNILASPFDADGGRHEVPVTLTAGRYRYFCTMPGHAQMVGELVVTGDGGGGDTTPPAVTADVAGTRDAAGNYVGSATVTIAATDTGSGVATVEYSLDGAAWTPYTAPVVVTTVGTHMLHYRATDVAGNVAAEKMAGFTVVRAGSDACPDSDRRRTVVIRGDDTGVANADTGNGCTINDLIAEQAVYPDHASFVRHVQDVTNRLVTSGTLTLRQQGAIVRTAARSTVGG